MRVTITPGELTTVAAAIVLAGWLKQRFAERTYVREGIEDLEDLANE